MPEIIEFDDLGRPYPICEKCGSQGPHVACYEGHGVAIRLCKKSDCDAPYLAKVIEETSKANANLKTWKEDYKKGLIS